MLAVRECGRRSRQQHTRSYGDRPRGKAPLAGVDTTSASPARAIQTGTATELILFGGWYLISARTWFTGPIREAGSDAELADIERELRAP